MFLHRDINNKRDNYLSWTDYFMATAFLVAKRSKDPCSQVGACIVNEDKKIVGVGYNGMPTGCSDDEFPWSKEKHSKLDTKYLYGKRSGNSDLFSLDMWDISLL
jgi:dCMP deaminase